MATAAGRTPRSTEPVGPRLPAVLGPADADVAGWNETDLDEAAFSGLDLGGVDLSGRPADGVEFDRCRLAPAALGGAALRRAGFVDCVFAGGSLANLRAERSSMLRVDFDLLRMTGLQWIDGTLRDVTFRECRLDLSAFRFSTLQRVLFVDCNLVRADFTRVDLSGTRFERCDLTAAQFSHATMAGVRLRDCVLDGIGGVESFAGAIVTTADLVGLARTMATALGITIDESSG